MDDQRFFALGKPTHFVIIDGISPFTDLGLQLAMRHRDAAVRMVRGAKSTTVEAFFDEVSAALQFPYYFGENWGAFDECIVDLDWIDARAYLILVSDAASLLRDADSEDFRILTNALTRANQEWLTPNQYIPRNREPTPFHVLLQCEADQLSALVERLDRAGAEHVVVPGD